MCSESVIKIKQKSCQDGRKNFCMSRINEEFQKDSDFSLDGSKRDSSDISSVVSSDRNMYQMTFLSYHSYPLCY